MTIYNNPTVPIDSARCFCYLNGRFLNAPLHRNRRLLNPMRYILMPFAFTLLFCNTSHAGDFDLPLLPVTKQISAIAGRSNQLMSVQKESVTLGTSARGLPQIQLVISGTVSVSNEQVAQIIAMPSIITRKVDDKNIIHTDVLVEFSGMEDTTTNTVTLVDGPSAFQGYLSSFKTQIILEMAPSVQDVLGKPTSARHYNFRFPSVVGSEDLISVTYEPSTSTVK